MPKQQPIVVEGTVLEALGSGLFKVELPTGQSIICHPSGKMRMHMINILPGGNSTLNNPEPNASRTVPSTTIGCCLGILIYFMFINF